MTSDEYRKATAVEPAEHLLTESEYMLWIKKPMLYLRPAKCSNRDNNTQSPQYQTIFGKQAPIKQFEAGTDQNHQRNCIN